MSYQGVKAFEAKEWRILVPIGVWKRGNNISQKTNAMMSRIEPVGATISSIVIVSPKSLRLKTHIRDLHESFAEASCCY